MKDNEINILNLIEQITPLNNKYRDLVDSGASGASVLEIMWEGGKKLEDYLKEHDDKPHKLYWQIYGKAEGLKKSYITRDFLSYCLRIKKYFESKNQIKGQFSKLISYSLFREALPLLENPKFKLSNKEYPELLVLLNSNQSLRVIKSKIIGIKSKKIGIKNTRTQKLKEMEPYSKAFVDFYNSIFQLLKLNKIKDIKNIRATAKGEYLNNISQLVSALTQEDLFVPEIELNNKLPKIWADFVSKVLVLFKSNVETRNRFRRLVPANKITNLAEMVNALKDDRLLEVYKIRNNLNV